MDIQQERQRYSLAQDLKQTWEMIVIGFWLLYITAFVLLVLLLPFLYYSGALADMHAWFGSLWSDADQYLRSHPMILLGVPFAALFALAIPQWIKEANEKRNKR